MNRSPSSIPIKSFLALILLATPAGAQHFAELPGRHLPSDIGHAPGLTLEDIDADGDLDLILGPEVYRNDGSGVFFESGSAPSAGGILAAGDVDGDGDVDFVIRLRGIFEFPPQDRLYLNNGTGTFAEATAGRLPPAVNQPSSIVLGDVNGDGAPDLVFGDANQQNRLLLNDGTGNFTDVTASHMPLDNDPTVSVVLDDVDGDGAADLIFGNGGSSSGHQNRLYVNAGNGVFTDVTAARMPARVDPTRVIAVGDLDGDGDRDLIIANAGEQNRLYLNDGSGFFTDATSGRLPSAQNDTAALDLEDVDGDGDLDLVLGEDEIRLHLNDGSGSFVDVTATHLPLDGAADVVLLGDVDNDGDPDLVSWKPSGGFTGPPAVSRLYLNDGAGVFRDTSRHRLPRSGGFLTAAALGDVDGNGGVDIVLAKSAEQDRLYLNDGTGTFTDVTGTHMPVDSDPASDVELQDVDRDGDLDLVFGGPQIRLYLNDGTGIFQDVTATHMPLGGSTCIALGDLDGDGDPDLAIGNAFVSCGGQNQLYLNDGTGVFQDATAGRLPALLEESVSVVLGDVDADGDSDLIFGNLRGGYCSLGHRSRLYLNDGGGRFSDGSAGRLPPVHEGPHSVVLSDVDVDGDPDLVIGHVTGGFCSGVQNQLFLNDGSGTFTDATAARLPAVLDETWTVIAGDVDGDGDPDLVFGNSGGSVFCWLPPTRLYLNDGNGVFEDGCCLPPGTWPLAFGDVDGDADLDLVGGGGPARLYLNLLRQLDAPTLARPGATFYLEAHARGGPPRAVDLVLPFVSPGTSNIALPPLGTLRLDPNRLVSLPPFLIPSNGVGSVSIAVPDDPNLEGVAIYTQALHVQYPVRERLSNYTADVILRY